MLIYAIKIMTKIIDMEGIDISLINNGINNAWDLLAKNPESSLFYSLITVLIYIIHEV